MFIYLVLLLMSLLQNAWGCEEKKPNAGWQYRCPVFDEEVQENQTAILQGNLEICLEVDGNPQSPTVPIKVGQTVELTITPQGGGWFGFYMGTPEGTVIPLITLKKVMAGEMVSMPTQIVRPPVGVDHAYLIGADKLATDLEIGRLLGAVTVPTPLEKSGSCVTANFSEGVVYIPFTSEE